MRTRLVAVAIAVGALAFGLAPGADANPGAASGDPRRIICGGVRSLDIGFCLDNPLPGASK